MPIESQIDHENEDTTLNPMLPTLQRDEKTGLWQWPILLNGDYSHWTNEPCAILFAQALRGDALWPTVSAELLSNKWPRLLPFYMGDFALLVLAPHYSVEQALLLAEDINRQTSEVVLPPALYRAPTEQRLTWGIVSASAPWNMISALNEAVAQQDKARTEERIGSINISEETRFDSCRDLAVFTGRDWLTNLWSRPLMFAPPRVEDESVAMLMGDIDNFKRLNGTIGHGAGDAALQAIAETLRPFQSPDVVLYRQGGDEFTFLLHDFSRERAETMAHEINAQLAVRQWGMDYGGPFPVPLLTWGGVVASPNKADFPQMLRRADDLVLAAKEERRGSVKIETW